MRRPGHATVVALQQQFVVGVGRTSQRPSVLSEDSHSNLHLRKRVFASMSLAGARCGRSYKRYALKGKKDGEAPCGEGRRLKKPQPTAHVQHSCLPHLTTPRAHRRRTQSRTPHGHRRPHTNRQPLTHLPPLVPKPSLGPRRLTTTTLCPPSLAHRRWLGELG